MPTFHNSRLESRIKIYSSFIKMNVRIENVDQLFVAACLELMQPKASEFFKKNKRYHVPERLKNIIVDDYKTYMENFGFIDEIYLSMFFQRQVHVLIRKNREKIFRINEKKLNDPLFIIYDK